jgi:hypothetical protein
MRQLNYLLYKNIFKDILFCAPAIINVGDSSILKQGHDRREIQPKELILKRRKFA